MDKVLKIQNLIKESKNIVFLSGAGISTNSGCQILEAITASGRPISQSCFEIS